MGQVLKASVWFADTVVMVIDREVRGLGSLLDSQHISVVMTWTRQYIAEWL